MSEVLKEYAVSKEGLKMDMEKIQAIVNFPTPRSIFEVRNLHDFVTFYRKFIRSFSNICAPIIETIEETNQPLKWTKAADQKFKLLNTLSRVNLIMQKLHEDVKSRWEECSSKDNKEQI